MRILAVTAEMFPFVKTGGLADATSALPQALERKGADVRTLLPLYRGLTPLVRGRKPVLVANILEQPVSVYYVVSDGHKLAYSYMGSGTLNARYGVATFFRIAAGYGHVASCAG